MAGVMQAYVVSQIVEAQRVRCIRKGEQRHK